MGKPKSPPRRSRAPGGGGDGDDAAKPAAEPLPASTVTEPIPATSLPIHPSLPFRVVGVGCSAGGLEAVTDLLGHLAHDTGMAFVLVQHLDPAHESLLTPLLARATEMPVVTAEDGMAVEPDHLYIIPPDKTLELGAGTLSLSPRARSVESHYTINRFFRSLATAQQHLGIGVVLSGADSDGALGVAAIKEQGGVVLAQEPSSATHGGMPRHAIDTGCVDLIGPPGQLADELQRLAGTSPETLVATPAIADGALRNVFRILQTATDVDFSFYKPSTIHRRLARRMALVGAETVPAYLKYLQGRPSEIDSLYLDLLINVTRFFRDTQAFEALRETAWPAVLAARDGQERPIRVWVPGCSTGEECYSLAVCLFEYLEEHTPGTPVQIFGTDVSESVLERARAGIYPEDIKLDVSPDRLRRFFARTDNGFQITKALRDSCVFARQNLTKDPPFSGLDLISCRNVLIYFTAQAQRRVLPVFHFALRPNGFLLLGSAETVGAAHGDLFRVADKASNLYAKEQVPTRFDWELGRFEGSGPPVPAAPEAQAPATRAMRQDPSREVDRVLLDMFAPPGLVVTDSLDVVHFRGDTRHFLAPSSGQASLNLLKLLRTELLPGVPRALRAARGRIGPTRRPAGRLEIDGHEVDVSVDVVPIPLSGRTSYYLVLFEVSGDHRARHVQPVRRAGGTRRVRELEESLVAAKEALRTLVDEQASVNEELRSANEEVIASNEELHATNEELEAAREELQATNEELATLNEQLQTRNRELSHLTSDLTNLLASLSMPILMVGRDLRFRRITPLATRVLNVRPSDVGRPMSEIRTRLSGPPLEGLVQEVLETLVAREIEIEDAEGRWWQVRVRPSKTEQQQIDGVVIVLVDITDLKTVAAGLQAAREHADRIVATVREPLLVLDGAGRIRSANRAFCRAFQVNAGDVEGRWLAEIGNGQWGRPEIAGLLKTIPRDDHAFHQVEVEGAFEPLGERRLMLTARRLDAHVGEDGAVLLAIDDVTERAHAEQAREASDKEVLLGEREARAEAEAANRAKDVFLATLSHELRTPLTSMLGWIRMLRGGKLDAPSVERALEAIERNTKAQVQLIEDLLDVSRVTSGKLRLDFRPVDVARAVGAAVDAIRPAALVKDITLTVDIGGDGTVLGDRDRLQQVVWNMLSNAIKFTPKAGRVEVGLHRAGARLRLMVRDTGMGIAPEVLPHVFDRFQQGSDSPTRPQGGLGLGLAIVRHIVELHGGTVTAQSDGANRGAVFTVELPLVRIPTAATTETLQEPPPITGEVPAGDEDVLAAVHVMLVEDDHDARDMLTAVLQQYGARVVAVGSVREAMDALAQEVPDVIVADIAMPEEDGYTLIRRVRALPAERGGLVPAVALTA